MDSYDKLMGLLEKEMQAFEDSYKSMTTTQVYNDWYIIGFYNEYFDMLTTGISGQLWLDDSIIAWLANKEQPLNFLYDKWMSCDGSFSHDWEEMLDWVNLVYGEEKDKDIPKDKIMVATLDDGYYAKHHSYPEEYSSEYAHEVYTFDTPEDFIQRWYELDEGAWYWVFDKGEIVCSGALDPNDIEIFEEYWGKTFINSELDLDLPATLTIPIATLDEEFGVATSEEEFEDIVSDYLSDEFGFCHKGFNMTVVRDSYNIPREVVVTNIKWDVDEKDRCSLDELIENANSTVQEPSDDEQPGINTRFEKTI